MYTHFKYSFSHFVRFSDMKIISQKFLAINQAVAQLSSFLLWTLHMPSRRLRRPPQLVQAHSGSGRRPRQRTHETTRPRNAPRSQHPVAARVAATMPNTTVQPERSPARFTPEHRSIVSHFHLTPSPRRVEHLRGARQRLWSAVYLY